MSPLDEGALQDRVKSFVSALEKDEDNSAIVRQYLLHGSCYAIDENSHYALKNEIANRFAVEVNRDIFVVGSAKLGFSIAPKKRYRGFGDASDIDIAIVSHSLYERVWHEVHKYQESGAYWPEKSSFERYAAWGWIRPDKLPTGSFSFRKEWWDFFRQLQRSRQFGPYKIAAGLYHDMHFLENYQNRAVSLCRISSPSDRMEVI